ncbi:MAG: TonB-dependent receptor [Crocinitomicaceae bacterium]|nr:TonB-dependent receptor [Crocinitomicaceae bacterium]
MKNVLILLTFIPFCALSQVKGIVIDKDSKDPVIGAKIMASTGEKVLSDGDGRFSIHPNSYPTTLILSATTFLTDTIVIERPGDYLFNMLEIIQVIKTVVVSAGRRDQEIEDVSISMEILKPELIDNKGIVDLEQAVDQSPGVYAMDGQVSIRGGSGFAYGAGSRVLLLWNGIPIISGDAGDVKWNTVPIENASQIEVIKGASSVLYGSGALNGIISLSEREPSKKGQLRAKVQAGIYDNPKRPTLKWWSSNPMFFQGEVFYGKMYKKFGYTISVNALQNQGYKEGEIEDRGRISGSLFFRPEKMKKLKIGVGYNLQYQKTGNFIIWKSDTFAYTPSGGGDTSDPSSTLTYNSGLTASIDPYLKVYDKYNNLHSIKTRYYYIDRTNITNPDQSTGSGVLYGDYQFQRKWSRGTVLTSGLTALRSDVTSNLFGDHVSTNFALYSQFEKRLKKFDISGGVRLEYFEQDGIAGDSDFYFGKDTTNAKKLPVYPILRLGTHYELFKFTHLRASFGQGIRYPSIAERYTKTSVGALNIFPNANLRPETGWAAEIGVKQVVKIGENWKGVLDLAGFVNQYDNMMEFTFGVYIPEGTSVTLNPDDQNYFGNFVGFQAQNAEKARITGLEFSFNSQGKIGDVELTSLIGYTYMNPVSLNDDSIYVATFSDSNSSVLKYRFNHLAKADIEVKWKDISVGISSRYNSYMSNIDKTFVEGISILGQEPIQILPGLKEYRTVNNKGNLIFDARIGYEFMEHYRLGFVVNNLLNEEVVGRPGDVQAPRTFLLQLQFKF